MRTETKAKLAVVLVMALLAAMRQKAKMLDDFDVPEFMRPKTILCAEDGCTKRVLAGTTRCIDCTVKGDLPKFWGQVDHMLGATGKH